jgi:hypothetical protein
VGKKIKDRLIKTETLEAKYTGLGEDTISQTSSSESMQSAPAIIGVTKRQVYVFKTSKGERKFPTIYFPNQPAAEEDYVIEETSFLIFPISDKIKRV